MTVSVNEIPLATITAEIITQIGEDLSSSHVISGLAGSDGGGLVLDIASGTARIAGYRADSDGTVNQTLTDAATNYVYFSLTTDAQARINGAEFTDYVTTQAENMNLLIAEVDCSGGDISTITDQRVYKPISTQDIRDGSILQIGNAFVTSGSTTSVSWTGLASQTLTTGNSTVSCSHSCAFRNYEAGSGGNLGLWIDDVQQQTSGGGVSPTEGDYFQMSIAILTEVSAATHTFTLKWSAQTGGTLETASSSYFGVIEYKI